MNKTILALSIAAFATSATAVEVYSQDGTEVNVTGKVGVTLKQEAKRKIDAKNRGLKGESTGDKKRWDESTKYNSHTELSLNDSTISIEASQELENDITVTGNIGLKAKTSDVELDEATIAISGDRGTITAGMQDTYTKVAQASGNAVVKYDNSVGDFKFGASYVFPTDRRNSKDSKPQDNEIDFGKMKNAYDVGFSHKVWGISYGASFGRVNYVQEQVTDQNKELKEGIRHFKQAVNGWFSHGLPFVQGLTNKLSVTYSYERNKNVLTKNLKVAPSLTYMISKEISVTAGYSYSRKLETADALYSSKEAGNSYSLSLSYKIAKNIAASLSGSFGVTKVYDNKTQDEQKASKKVYPIDDTLRRTWTKRNKSVQAGLSLSF